MARPWRRNKTQSDGLRRPNDGSESDNFGKSVAIFNDRIIVGASSDYVVSNADQGSAYIFHAYPIRGHKKQS